MLQQSGTRYLLTLIVIVAIVSLMIFVLNKNQFTAYPVLCETANILSHENCTQSRKDKYFIDKVNSKVTFQAGTNTVESNECTIISKRNWTCTDSYYPLISEFGAYRGYFFTREDNSFPDTRLYYVGAFEWRLHGLTDKISNLLLTTLNIEIYAKKRTQRLQDEEFRIKMNKLHSE